MHALYRAEEKHLSRTQTHEMYSLDLHIYLKDLGVIASHLFLERV